MNITPTVECRECGRTFDLWNPEDADEWASGHDCEAPRDTVADAPRFDTREDMHGAHIVRPVAGCTGHIRADVKERPGIPDVLILSLQHDGPSCPVHEAAQDSRD